MGKFVADYQVLVDGGFTLDAASNDKKKELFWSIPDGFKHFDGSRKPILAFHAHVVKNSKFKVKIHVNEILSWNLTAGNTCGLWDPFNGSVAFPEGQTHPNPVPVIFSISEGKINFGQVVIWYQVEV